MELFSDPEKLDRYLSGHTSPEDKVLSELTRHTYLNEVHPRMLSGHILGNFLRMFSQMISPKHILEIGTYTGYSAICLAEGLAENGHLHTIEINEELKDQNQKYFESAGLKSKITSHFGKALDIIPQLGIQFDLVFMDPPYRKNMIEPTLRNLHISQSLVSGTRVIIEHSQREPVVAGQLPYEIADQRKYGKTLVTFLDYVV